MLRFLTVRHTHRVTFRIRIGGRLILLLLCFSAAGWTQEAENSNAGLEFFEQRIRPVLVDHCHQCHSTKADEIQAGLRLDSQAGWQQGGDSGPAIKPGEPEQSLLWKALRYDDDVSPMPPDQKLPDEIVEDFERWIRLGAPAPRSDQTAAAVADAPPSGENHWAFQPPRIVPSGPDPDRWAETQLDRYVRDAQRQVSVQPSLAAPRETLIRRLFFDLVGLPPDHAAVEAFVSDRTPDAYRHLVNELLASPRFGERWARHWLDVARYADTKGYVFQEDRNYPEAFRYRDWVIDSLNHDRPYDEFLQYQLAADVLSEDHPEDLAAMGFLTLGRRFLNNRHDIIDDRIDVVTRGLMALTVSCARCHDHKYDPIPTDDYYSLYGVFASCDEPGGEPTALRLVDRDSPQTAYVFRRGNPQNRGQEVPRQFLALLSGPERRPFQNGSGRGEMALAITRAENPLTARVLVNRVWGKLFGSFLVDTPSDFGTRSEQPPLLPALDYLAVEFMQHDWSIKWLVEELVTSATYQQASTDRPTAAERDPENRTYWRANRRRLDFEAMRDAVLHVSGRLQAESVGGPSVPITGETPSARRTLYAFIDRQNLPGLFRVFDVANPDTHAPKRFETTVPQQALFMLNSPFLLDQARAAAERVLADSPSEAGPRVSGLYHQILARDPSPQELGLSTQFIGEAASAEDPAVAWQQLAQVLLLSNEFLFLD